MLELLCFQRFHYKRLTVAKEIRVLKVKIPQTIEFCFNFFCTTTLKNLFLTEQLFNCVFFYERIKFFFRMKLEKKVQFIQIKKLGLSDPQVNL